MGLFMNCVVCTSRQAQEEIKTFEARFEDISLGAVSYVVIATVLLMLMAVFSELAT